MPPIEKFGQYLLRNQVVTQEQLNEALQCQVIFGGRLGTNLVELGYLTLDDLARLLSRRSGYPAASPEELEELPRDILGSLPKQVIEKFKIIPIRIEAKTLHLAVCDPTDVKTMDEIAFATGMRIKPYLLPELRMFYLLERHYGIKRDIRYIRLGRSVSRGKYGGALVGTPATVAADGGGGVAPPWAAAEPSLTGVPGAMPRSPTEELELKGFHRLKEGEELTDEPTHEEQMQISSASLAEQANSPTAKMRAGIAPTREVLEGITPPAAMPAMTSAASIGPAIAIAPAPVAPPLPLALGVAIPEPPPLPQVAPPPPVVPVPLAAPAPVPIAVAANGATPSASAALPFLDETHLEPIEPVADDVTPSAVPFPPPTSATERSALQSTLSTAQDRDEAAGAALRLARGSAHVVALFIVNKGILSGWKGAGAALDTQGIESVMLPVSADSILKSAATGVPFQGPVPKGGLNDRLIAALGRTQPLHAVVLPISLGPRVVNLLYADGGHKPLGPDEIAALQVVAREIGSAYERIIRTKKKS